MNNYILEEAYFNNKKLEFKSLFSKNADDNLDLFFQYLLEGTNRRLVSEFEEINKNFSEIRDSGFFEGNN